MADKFKKVGEDTFMGKKCEIIDMEGYKRWMWNGIALKKQLDMLPAGQWYKYAIAIDENYVIKKDEFKIPAGIVMQKTSMW